MLGMLINMEYLKDIQGEYIEIILEKMQRVLTSWGPRHLTILGKVQVVNSRVASLLIYKMQILPCLDPEINTGIKMLMSRFIWNGRKPKMRTNYLMLDKAMGGRRLTDVAARDKSLKIEWIRHTVMSEDKVLK